MKPKIDRKPIRLFLSDDRKVMIYRKLRKRKFIGFAMQYLLYYEGKWRRITRYDTLAHHGGSLHRHIFHFKNKRHDRIIDLGEWQYKSPSQSYKFCYDDLLKNYRKYERYYFQL